MRNSSNESRRWPAAKPGGRRMRVYQLLLAVALLVLWQLATSPTLLPPIYFDDPNKAAFFFGEPLKAAVRIWVWFASGEIYRHLWVTLIETLLAFVIGTVSGLVVGIWLGLSPTASAVFEPFLHAGNRSPGGIVARVFFRWVGLGSASTVAAGCRSRQRLTQIPPRMRLRPGHVLGRAGGDDAPAPLAALGAQIDDPVGALDDVEMVLDHQHRVARVDQAVQALRSL